MRILLWHVHGSWTTSFVQGRHEYVLPVTVDRGPDGLGRGNYQFWPSTVEETPVSLLRDESFDVVILQRPHEADLAREWTGRVPGNDVPAIYLEHNTPKGAVPETRHPLADQTEIPIAHVTAFNELMWDNGSAPTVVIDHGVLDPGRLYTGEFARAAVAINEPVRRNRVTGTDLLPRFAQVCPIDVFGIDAHRILDVPGFDRRRISAYSDPPQVEMHARIARRRVYLHLMRWTSLGLSLIEAMMLGMPVVVLASTEAIEAVPHDAGAISTRLDVLLDAQRRFIADPDWARQVGKHARAAALARYSVDRFLADWDRLLAEVAR